MKFETAYQAELRKIIFYKYERCLCRFREQNSTTDVCITGRHHTTHSNT